MKKSNTYLADDEMDLRDLIEKLWKEKILILSISIICGLLGYFYVLSKSQEFKTEITIKNVPVQIFEPYNLSKSNNIAEQFIFDFKVNFLSLDSLQSFVEESREFDNFKAYLKLKNISPREYFVNKIGQVEKKNIIIPNKYFLNHPKELDGDFFFSKYVEFIKKKTIIDCKNRIKLTILNTINNHQEALEIAKKIQLERPFLYADWKALQNMQNVEPETLFFKGTIVLSENINNFNKILIKLENDPFNYNTIIQNALTQKKSKSLPLYFAFGLSLGLFLSLGIIFLKADKKKKK